MIMRNEEDEEVEEGCGPFLMCCFVFCIRRYACCLGYDTTRRLI